MESNYWLEVQELASRPFVNMDGQLTVSVAGSADDLLDHACISHRWSGIASYMEGMPRLRTPLDASPEIRPHWRGFCTDICISQ